MTEITAKDYAKQFGVSVPTAHRRLAEQATGTKMRTIKTRVTNNQFAYTAKSHQRVYLLEGDPK